MAIFDPSRPAERQAEQQAGHGACTCGDCAANPDDAAWSSHPAAHSLHLASRRGFLRSGVAGVGAVALAGSLGAGSFGTLVSWPRAALAQSDLAPDEALARMMAGNKRFVEQRLTSFDEDLTILKQKTAGKQEPFAAVLSCADSRVPVELIFDQSIGHVFVTRVAGNVATPEIIASLEYGAAVLGTRAIVVLGHSGCGAVKATIDAKEVPGQISALYAPLRPAVDAVGVDAKKTGATGSSKESDTLTAAIRANAEIQAHLLATASPVLAGLIKDHKLVVAAAYYDLASGRVEQLS